METATQDLIPNYRNIIQVLVTCDDERMMIDII